MSTWLDTETKALLQQLPPQKLAPPGTDTFTLVVLKCSGDRKRLAQLMARITAWGHAPTAGFSNADVARGRTLAWNLGVNNGRAALLAYGSSGPLVAGLSFTEALNAQFELVCHNAVSIFLRDEVVSSATKEYLNELYSSVQSSSEFENVTVRISSIPDSDSGRQFIQQFLGDEQRILFNKRGRNYSCEEKLMRKKARIVRHWGTKIGAEVIVIDEKRE